MSRLDAMLSRLPPPLTDDPTSLLGRILGGLAVQMGCVDEEMDRIQRSHWLETAFDLSDLAALGALFGLAPASWEPTALFRTRLRATIAARLSGAVTRTAMEGVLVALLDGAQEGLGLRHAALTRGAGGRVFRDPEAARRPGAPVFREFPTRRVRDAAMVAGGGRLRPLDRAVLTHRGLGETPLQAVLRGRVGGVSTSPLLAHLGSGRVVLFRGLIPAGAELRLHATAQALTASLEGQDVTERLVTAGGFAPGAALPLPTDATPRPLLLSPGHNEIWFLPLGLFDVRMLDRGAFAMPGLALRQGMFGGAEAPGSAFDDSLFEQPPAISADFFWEEAMPATFRFEIPGGVVRHASPPADRAGQRAAVLEVMQATVALLRAAGVDGRVTYAALRETQESRSRGRAINPRLPPVRQHSETRLGGVTALFDETARQGARFA